MKRTISGFANENSGGIAIGFDDNGALIGIDDPDETERKAKGSLTELSPIRILYKVLKDSENNFGIIMMIPRMKKPVHHGESLIIRDGNSFREANDNEIYEIQNRLKSTQGGHLWYISFRNYVQKIR